MEIKNKIEPRHIITIVALIITGVLAITESINRRMAFIIIVGVLASYGSYQAVDKVRKKE